MPGSQETLRCIATRVATCVMPRPRHAQCRVVLACRLTAFEGIKLPDKRHLMCCTILTAPACTEHIGSVQEHTTARWQWLRGSWCWCGWRVVCRALLGTAVVLSTRGAPESRHCVLAGTWCSDIVVRRSEHSIIGKIRVDGVAYACYSIHAASGF